MASPTHGVEPWSLCCCQPSRASWVRGNDAREPLQYVNHMVSLELGERILRAAVLRTALSTDLVERCQCVRCPQNHRRNVRLSCWFSVCQVSTSHDHSILSGRSQQGDCARFYEFGQR